MEETLYTRALVSTASRFLFSLCTGCRRTSWYTGREMPRGLALVDWSPLAETADAKAAMQAKSRTQSAAMLIDVPELAEWS